MRGELKKKLDVIGFGALNMDWLCRVEKIVSDGEVAIREEILSPGGSAANTIFALARLGVKTGFLGAVGDDKEGETLLQDFNGVGVDVSQVKVKKGYKTGLVIGLVDSEGNRSLYVLPRANSLLKKEDLSLDYVNQANVLHLSSFVDEEQLLLQKWLVEQSANTVTISFAPGSLYANRGMESLLPILRKTYLVFLTKEELEILTKRQFYKGVSALRKIGVRIVAITLGEKGCYVSNGSKEIKISPPKIEVKDTTGGGDAFTTGFLYGILKGRDLKECALIGNIVASACISKMGARSGLPNEEELKALSQYYYNLTI